MNDILKKNEWDNSYKNKDNFVYYPHEEVIRFSAKYIIKRTGYNIFEKKHQFVENVRVLDLGCGIGRHVKFFLDTGIDGYGIDLSDEAIAVAKDILLSNGHKEKIKNLLVGDVTNMPFPDGFFHFAVSHGVLDSMNFDLAKRTIKEMYRCLNQRGFFYLDLISGDDSDHFPQFCGEEVVKSKHEEGTIQTYYNWSKIEKLLEGFFKPREATLLKSISQLNRSVKSRFHLTLEKI